MRKPTFRSGDGLEVGKANEVAVVAATTVVPVPQCGVPALKKKFDKMDKTINSIPLNK